MELLIPVLILTVVFATVRIPLFEGVFSTLLLLPVMSFAVTKFGLLSGEAGVSPVPNFNLYSAITAISIVVIAVLYRLQVQVADRKYDLRGELQPMLVFGVAYVVIFSFTQLWPDFVSIGERLRDYAILSSALKNPLDVAEPWFNGYQINYYLYWYRFGHVLSTVLTLPVWDTYHALQSFTFTLYFTCAYLAFYRFIARSNLWGVVAATVIAFGSNVGGIRDLIFSDPNWWGPSRVIKGAINEFPAWSFLLGDVHPHFLNLPLIPFILLLLARASKAATSRVEVALMWLLAAAITCLLVYNSNAWELPTTVALFGAIAVLASVAAISTKGGSYTPPSLAQLGAWTVLTAFLAVTLVEFASSVKGGDLALAAVGGPIQRTVLFEFLLHWGVPTSITILALFFLQKSGLERLTVFVASLAALLMPEAIWLIVLIIVVAGFYSWKRMRQGEWHEVIICGWGLSAWCALLFPELFFFNDSYGGDIERMNTIFKFYSYAWLPINLFAFYLLNRAAQAVSLARLPVGVTGALAAGALFLMLGFFLHTVPLRMSKPCTVTPCSRGLSTLESEFKGGADTVKLLSALRPGVVLEAQGAPYSMTSHVATLSSQTSYLGWANHIGLLLKEYGEVARREGVTRSVYSGEKSCQDVAQLLRAEKIDYLVVGPLERRAFPNLKSDTFSCLGQIIQSGEYSVYSG